MIPAPAFVSIWRTAATPFSNSTNVGCASTLISGFGYRVELLAHPGLALRSNYSICRWMALPRLKRVRAGSGIWSPPLRSATFLFVPPGVRKNQSTRFHARTGVIAMCPGPSQASHRVASGPDASVTRPFLVLPCQPLQDGPRVARHSAGITAPFVGADLTRRRQ